MSVVIGYVGVWLRYCRKTPWNNIVVELKAVSFEPEFAGKLNFYVNAVNDLIRTPDENPTIGLLICKDKDQTEVQWAFQGIQTPMGVAAYDNIKIEEINYL